MASSDWWDSAHVPAPRGSEPARVEHVLWTLRKTGRTAEARVPAHPHGQELRFLVDGELVWSEAFRPGRGTVLGEVAEPKRVEFQERGWTP